MTGISSLIKNGQLLQAQASSEAITGNDLVEMNSATGQVISVKNSDYSAINIAGSNAFPTQSPGSDTSNWLNWRKSGYVDTDGSIYMLAENASGIDLKIVKYTSAGFLLASTVLNTSGTMCSNASIAKLSNGNFALSWSNTSLQHFAIVDPVLNVVVAKTSTGIIGDDGGPSYSPDLISLSGGGFAIAGQLNNGGGVSYIIYTNTGSVTKALTGVTSSPATGTQVYARMVQLTNGNIVIAISAIVAGKYLGFAIYDAAGNAQVAYTAVNTTTTTLAQPPEISRIGNFFALAWNDDTNANAYVYSNAGVTTATLQGSAFSMANATPTTLRIRLINDGAAFWFIFGRATTNSVVVNYIPTSGTGYVTTVTVATISGSANRYSSDAMINGNSLIFATSGSTCSNFIIDNVTKKVFRNNVFLATQSILYQILPTFGFSFIEFSNGSFTPQKYVNSAIVGIAQSTVAANNSGTLVNVNQGVGAYSINAISGTSGKQFSHGGGNRGVMYTNSVALSGVSNPRNIN